MGEIIRGNLEPAHGRLFRWCCCCCIRCCFFGQLAHRPCRRFTGYSVRAGRERRAGCFDKSRFVAGTNRRCWEFLNSTTRYDMTDSEWWKFKFDLEGESLSRFIFWSLRRGRTRYIYIYFFFGSLLRIPSNQWNESIKMK